MAENENKFNRYIRERIRLAREEAGISQEELAKVLHKTRVAVSDLERGRVNVNAVDLFFIAHTLKKPISYFFPSTNQSAEKLPPIVHEAVIQLMELPEVQQLMALEYVRQQRQMYEKASQRADNEGVQNIRFED